jgi:pseudomonalisin
VVGVAPGAQVDLVISGSLGNNNGIFIAAQYEVQALRDPVMSISFGGCEAYSGAPGVAQWDALFSQAASEGISIFVSSGDSGAAGCDPSFLPASGNQFLSINAICSSSFATCVGGTEFADFNNPSLYWSTTNGNGLVSAQGYISEGAWNESATYDSSLGGYPVAAGGGGASVYVEKPWWQSGTGVPNDHAREVPDVSFPGASHDGYYGCFAAGGGDCGSNYFTVFSGTSAAAPSMAGVSAILNQKMGGAQGNLNPLLYRIAASNPNAFHDATPASSRVSSCSLSTPGLCNNSTPSATGLAGGLAGYALTSGYDQVTGLGSLDIANFLAAAASASHPGVAATTLAIRGSATTITDKQTATFTATVSSSTSGKPKGTVQFYANGSALGTAVPVSSGMATAALPFPSAGTYYITANYSGDTNYAASTAPGSTLVVTGLASSTTVTASSTSILVGMNATLSVSVAGNAGSPTPTGVVRFLALGNTVASVPLVNGRATTPAFNFPTIGSYTVSADYLGDSVYSPSNSAPLSLMVTKLQSFVQLSSTGASIGTAGSSVIGVYVGGASGSSGSSAPAATGMVQLYSNGVALGSPLTVTQGSQGFSPPEIFSTAGTFTITAVYSGDANWMSSTSNAISQTVLSQPATLQMTHTTQALSFIAGATTSNTDPVAVTGSLGFTGTANLFCTVTYNGTGVANDIPQCLMTKSSQALNQAAASFQSTVTIYSIARQGVNVSSKNSPHREGWNLGEIGLCALVLWLVPIRPRNWRTLTTVLVLITGLTELSGCGGGKGSSAPTSAGATPALFGTTAGSYTVRIAATTTATGVAVPAPLTIALTIN